MKLFKALLVTIVVMFVVPVQPATAQALQWMRQFGTAGGEGALGVAVDATGNVYVAGPTGGTLAGQTSDGGADAFVRKYDSNGTELWARQFGTPGDEGALDVAVDATGNVYVAGVTGGTFAGQTSAGSLDAFVRKYDPNGTELWTRQFGTAGVDEPLGVAVDATGNVYVAGFTDGIFAGQTSAGGLDAFVRKYDANGTEVWTRQFGTADLDEAFGIAVDATGDVYVAGVTVGTLAGQTSAGGADAFVRKYDPNGTELWTRQFGTASNDSAFGVAMDATGNAYVAGGTDGTFAGQTSAGDKDAFVRKYDSNGTEVWTRQFGTAGLDDAIGVAVDATGNAYMAGFTNNTFAGQTSAGGVDAFVRKYDANGTEVWTQQFGTADGDEALGVAVDATGNAYVTGFTGGTFAGQTSAGGDDAFLAKLGASPAEQIGGLIGAVGATGLFAGNANSLTSKLAALQSSLASGNVTASCNQLGAFINEVNADVRTHKLSATQAAALIASANAIRAALGCK